jgi:hypothetical protein
MGGEHDRGHFRHDERGRQTGAVNPSALEIRQMRTSTLALVSVACLALGGWRSPPARAADPQTSAQTDTGGGAAMFQTIQKMVGRWEGRLPNNKTIVDTFQPFGAGAYMLHEEWVDGKQITASVFYRVGSQLWADHFCDYLNQPRYTAKSSGDPAVVDLEFRGATGLDTHPRHFHSTVWHLVDATHMTQVWHVMGGPKGKVTVEIDFVRTSPSA